MCLEGRGCIENSGVHISMHACICVNKLDYCLYKVSNLYKLWLGESKREGGCQHATKKMSWTLSFHEISTGNQSPLGNPDSIGLLFTVLAAHTTWIENSFGLMGFHQHTKPRAGVIGCPTPEKLRKFDIILIDHFWASNRVFWPILPIFPEFLKALNHQKKNK
jgi:hypothetical protein